MVLRHRFLCVSVLAFVLVSSPLAQDPVFIPNDPATPETRIAAEEIKGIVRDILQGADRPSIRSAITLGALLVEGGSKTDLSEALFGKSKSTAFIREADRKVTIERLSISPDATSAYLITEIQFKSRTESRFHSVFFMKDKQGDWKVKHWHTSR